jgi:hypothetical protein
MGERVMFLIHWNLYFDPKVYVLSMVLVWVYLPHLSLH